VRNKWILAREKTGKIKLLASCALYNIIDNFLPGIVQGIEPGCIARLCCNNYLSFLNHKSSFQ